MAVDQLELIVITGMSGAGEKTVAMQVSKTWDISVSIICHQVFTKFGN